MLHLSAPAPVTASGCSSIHSVSGEPSLTSAVAVAYVSAVVISFKIMTHSLQQSQVKVSTDYFGKAFLAKLTATPHPCALNNTPIAATKQQQL